MKCYTFTQNGLLLNFIYLIKEFCLLYSALGPLHETVIDRFSCRSVKKKKRVKWTEKEERLFFQVKVIIFI